MRLPSRFVLAAVLLGATGCLPDWPRIPGKWAEYALPAQTLVFAHAYWIIPKGAYWPSGTDPTGFAFWGVFTSPQDVTGYEMDGVDGQCVATSAVPQLDSFDPSGSGTSALLHGGLTVTLPWNAPYYANDLLGRDISPDTDYDLQIVQFGDYPAFQIPGLLHAPSSDFRVDYPPIDGQTPVQVDLNDLTITWSGADADRVEVDLVTFRNGTQLDVVSCVVPDTGSMTVPAGLFPHSANAQSVSVLIGPISFTGGRAPIGTGAGYRGTFSRDLEGAYSL
jgi:hypothetical protein